MGKKRNKIIVAVSTSEEERRSMVCRIAVQLGFALTPADAGKIVKGSILDYDLMNSYFVFVHTCNLRESPITTHRLYELAARGVAVVIGVKRLYSEHEFFSDAYYPSDFTRL